MTKDSEANTDEDAGDSAPVEVGTSPVEWIAAAIGGFLFFTMIAYMAFLGFQQADTPPIIMLETKPAVRSGSAFLVPFIASNSGDATAAGLVVTATLTQGEREVESAEITIDYLAGGSERRGGFFFRNDPGPLRLELSAKAYLEP
jgi:uncharacterized protein (TIGR02588 family)